MTRRNIIKIWLLRQFYGDFCFWPAETYLPIDVQQKSENECKDCVGAWVVQITGTGVGTLSEDRIYSQSNLCLPHIAKHLKGLEGESYWNLLSRLDFSWKRQDYPVFFPQTPTDKLNGSLRHFLVDVRAWCQVCRKAQNPFKIHWRSAKLHQALRPKV